MSTDRSPLINKNNDIINNLTKFYGDITEFEKSIKDVGTNRDTTTLRSSLHKKKINLGDDLKKMSQQIKQLPSSNLPKFQQDKIIKQFKEAHSKFEELLSLSNKKESSYEPIVPSVQQPQQNVYNNNNNNNNSNTRGEYGNNNYNYDQQQTYNGTINNNDDQLEQILKTGIQQDNEQFYDRIVDERNAQTKQLVQDIAMLNEAMRDVSSMVSEQGEMLEKADDNVYHADIAVEESVVELEKAYVYKSSARKKIIILIICLACTFAAIGLFLAVYFGVIKKRK